MQLGRIETEGQDSEIKPGDIVRLLQPFKPERFSFQEYTFAIVAGVVGDSSKRSDDYQLSNLAQTLEGQQPELNQIVVYLYEPDSSTTYTDKFGLKALFSFDSDEVELDVMT